MGKFDADLTYWCISDSFIGGSESSGEIAFV